MPDSADATVCLAMVPPTPESPATYCPPRLRRRQQRPWRGSAGRLVAMSTASRITADPAIMAGAPAIRGTRVTVSVVLGQLAAGSTVEELLADYPSLTRDDVLAALAFAAETMPQERPFIAA